MKYPRRRAIVLVGSLVTVYIYAAHSGTRTRQRENDEAPISEKPLVSGDGDGGNNLSWVMHGWDGGGGVVSRLLLCRLDRSRRREAAAVHMFVCANEEIQARREGI